MGDLISNRQEESFRVWQKGVLLQLNCRCFCSSVTTLDGQKSRDHIFLSIIMEGTQRYCQPSGSSGGELEITTITREEMKREEKTGNRSSILRIAFVTYEPQTPRLLLKVRSHYRLWAPFTSIHMHESIISFISCYVLVFGLHGKPKYILWSICQILWYL